MKPENNDPFLLLAQRLRAKRRTFKEKSLGIVRSFSQAFLWGNLKIGCFCTEEEQLQFIWIQSMKWHFSYVDLLIVFVKSDLITTNKVFCVKITYSILAEQRTLENYLKLTDTILNLYDTYLPHAMKPRLYFHSLLPQQNGETHF